MNGGQRAGSVVFSVAQCLPIAGGKYCMSINNLGKMENHF